MPYVNGVLMSAPGAAVVVNDQNFQANPGPGGLGVIFIGPATDGKPNTLLTFSSPNDAKAQLKGGDLLQGVLNAFAGAAFVGGSITVNAIRPEQATQATATINSSGAVAQIPLKATGYGVVGNSSKYMIQAGSTVGYKVSQATDFVGPGGQTYPPNVTDNISLPVLSISYNGTTPNVTITDTAFTLTANSAQVASIPLSTTTTVQQLVNQLNQIANCTAVVLDPNPQDATGALFDNVTSQTIGTSSASPTTLYANVTAVVRYFNNLNLYFTATRNAGATSLATSSTWTYASGATTPTAANGDWQNAYTTAQGVTGINFIAPVSSSQTLWGYNDAHCQYMASIGQPRRGYVGDAANQPFATELALVPNYNSNRTSIIWPGQAGVDFNGNPTNFAPYLYACFIMGMRAATVPFNALTQQPVPSNGMNQTATPAQVAQGLAGGMAIIAPNQQGIPVLQQDRTTWLQNTAYDKVENSTGLVADIITQDLLATLQTFIGKPVTPQMVSVATGKVLDRLVFWYNQGYLAEQPQASDVSLVGNGNTITGSAQAAIDVPANYIVLQLIPTAA